MTSLDKAKAYLASNARKLALRVLPLAAVVVAAHSVASAATFTGTGACSSSGGGFVTGGIALTPLPTANGVTGLKGDGLCSASFNALSGGGLATWTVEAFMLGSVTEGVFTGVEIPISWDFTPTVDLGGIITDGEILNYAVQFWLDSIQPVNVTGTAVAGSQVTGTQMITPNGTFNSWFYVVQIWVDVSGDASGSLNVDVPSNSLDINNPDDLSSVPEPGTALLFGGGGLLLITLGRRRRQA